jgi:hypothetical protein
MKTLVLKIWLNLICYLITINIFRYFLNYTVTAVELVTPVIISTIFIILANDIITYIVLKLNNKQDE